MKIKNLVVNNLGKIASVACVVGFQAAMLIIAKNSNVQDEEMLKLHGDIQIECPTQEVKLEIETPIDPEIQHFNLDDMISTADDKIAELDEQHMQEYIERLIIAYEEGIDPVDGAVINTDLFELTFDNQTYEHLPVDDFYLFMAVVAAECKKGTGSTHDALATACSVIARCEEPVWKNSNGSNPAEQVTAGGQYSVYASGAYRGYLNLENVPQEIYDACVAVWFYGVRNNYWCSFRSNGTVEYSNNQVVAGGNRFGGALVVIEPVPKLDKIQESELTVACLH